MFLKISSSASAFIPVPQIKFWCSNMWFSPASVPGSPSLTLGAPDLLCFLKFITWVMLAFSRLWILQAFGRCMDRSTEATILGPVWRHHCVHAVHTCSQGCEPPGGSLGIQGNLFRSMRPDGESRAKLVHLPPQCVYESPGLHLRMPILIQYVFSGIQGSTFFKKSHRYCCSWPGYHTLRSKRLRKYWPTHVNVHQRKRRFFKIV